MAVSRGTCFVCGDENASVVPPEHITSLLALGRACRDWLDGLEANEDLDSRIKQYARVAEAWENLVRGPHE